jgi:hypothetical protein
LRPPRASVASQQLQARQQRRRGAGGNAGWRRSAVTAAASAGTFLHKVPGQPPVCMLRRQRSALGDGGGRGKCEETPEETNLRVRSIRRRWGGVRTFFDFLDAWAPAPCPVRHALGYHYTAMTLGRHLRSFLSARAAVSCVFFLVSLPLTGAPCGGPPSTWHPCSRHAPLKGIPCSLEHDHTPLPSP